MEKNIANKLFSVKLKTVILTIVAIASFLFGVGVVYSTITSHSEDIAEMKPEVKKIPAIEKQMENLIKIGDETNAAVTRIEDYLLNKKTQ